ncbi:hypothetical protein CSAL01_10520 [Colletotrichum salicis]|uniref:Uncharacterized protein n=1 Tax=Colletotrichum salicis TaxID=1209931 RepID=A0A135U7T7_9PEZI|nr:hypothetical protein CSAL01_10520 [Colletotrichum salicis]
MEGTVPTATLAPSVFHRCRQPHHIERHIRVPKKKHSRYYQSRISPKQESHIILAIASQDSTPSISMSRSSSGKVSASSGSAANLNPSAQPFTPTRLDSSPTSTPVDHGMYMHMLAKYGHLNPPPPHMRGFVPPRFHVPAPPPPFGHVDQHPGSSHGHGAIPPSSSQHNANPQIAGDLAYHQAKAVEAANMAAAQGMPHAGYDPTHPVQPPFPPHPFYGPSPYGATHAAHAGPMPPSHPGLSFRPDSNLGSRPPGYGPDDHRSSPVDPAAAAGYSNYNPYAQYFQHTPPGPSSTPGSAGLSAGPFNPQTPPNRHSRPGQADPTPPAHTFSDDGEFYPGTDPRLKNHYRASNSQ